VKPENADSARLCSGAECAGRAEARPLHVEFRLRSTEGPAFSPAQNAPAYEVGTGSEAPADTRIARANREPRTVNRELPRQPATGHQPVPW